MVQISQAIELINKKVEDWRRSYTPGGAVSYRAPDDPKPYWDVPKASSMGFNSSYPAQPQQPQYSLGNVTNIRVGTYSSLAKVVSNQS